MRSSVTLRAEAYEQRQASKRAGLLWLGGVGNVCTTAALGLSLLINIQILDGSARGVVPISPLLLLLHPYASPFRTLSASNRYAPVVSAVAMVVSIAALVEVGSRVHVSGILSMRAVRGMLLVCCALPSLFLCCRFLWDLRQVSDLLVYCVAPLTTLPLLLSHERPIYDLGGLSLAAALLHLLMARRVRKASNKYI